MHANSLEAFVLAATVVVVSTVGVIPAWCDGTAALQQAVVVGALHIIAQGIAIDIIILIKRVAPQLLVSGTFRLND